MVASPMFPLGAVLFPHMPLRLRLFEDRYLIMLARVVKNDPAGFGVVLIERGQEVGGGEQRFRHGTFARIVDLEVGEDAVGLVAMGTTRFEVVEWVADDPYPRAVLRELDDLEWSDALEPLRDRAERTVRRVLAFASEFSDQRWPANVELAEDPIAAAWQLAAIAPLGPLDQVALLRSSSAAELLGSLIDRVAEVEQSIQPSWHEDDFGVDPEAP